MTTQNLVFTAAARESQAVFRAALQSLARPGRVYQLPAEVRPYPSEQARYAYAVLAALADHEVTIAVTGCDEATAAFTSLGTGSRLASDDKADYVLALGDDPLLPTRLRRGEPETPESGATLILAVDSLESASGMIVQLTGPGIAGDARLSVSGLGRATFEARNEACAAYPLGIELYLVDRAGRIAGLPRTTHITLEVQ